MREPHPAMGAFAAILCVALWTAFASTSCARDPLPSHGSAAAAGTARVTIALVHDETLAEERERALLSYVRRPKLDGCASHDGIVATVERPATTELEPGLYALLAQSLSEATCAVEFVQVVAGQDQHLDLRLLPGRRVSVEFPAATRASHFLVLEQGESILVQFAGPGVAALVLPDRDLELEVHASACMPVSRMSLPRGVAVLRVP